MKIRFVVATDEEFCPDIPVKLIESYRDPDNPFEGWDAYEAEVPHLPLIRTRNTETDEIWEADEAEWGHEGGSPAFYVTGWKRVKE